MSDTYSTDPNDPTPPPDDAVPAPTLDTHQSLIERVVMCLRHAVDMVPSLAGLDRLVKGLEADIASMKPPPAEVTDPLPEPPPEETPDPVTGEPVPNTEPQPDHSDASAPA